MHPNVSGRSYACHVTTLRDPLVQPLGKKASDTLEKVFGLRTVGDLLRHYPRRYYTRGELTPLDSLSEGDHVTVLARVAMASVLGDAPRGPRYQPGRGQRQRLEVIVTDGTGKLQLTFFAGAGFHARQLQQGALALFAGTVSSFRGRRQLVHPEYELLPDDGRRRAADQRNRGRVRHRAHPRLPGERQADLVDDLQARRRRPRLPRPEQGPASRRDAAAVPPVAA